MVNGQVLLEDSLDVVSLKDRLDVFSALRILRRLAGFVVSGAFYFTLMRRRALANYPWIWAACLSTWLH